MNPHIDKNNEQNIETANALSNKNFHQRNQNQTMSKRTFTSTTINESTTMTRNIDTNLKLRRTFFSSTIQRFQSSQKGRGGSTTVVKLSTLMTLIVSMTCLVMLLSFPLVFNESESSSHLSQLKEDLLSQGPPTSFPSECTWKCYLRQNDDLFLNSSNNKNKKEEGLDKSVSTAVNTNNVRWTEQKAIEHYLTIGYKEKRQCSCQIVLLAGPHKAASTTLQRIAVEYSKMKNVQWKWIGNGPKAFSSFVTTFYGRGNGDSNGIDNDFEHVKRTFQDEIEKHYNDGYSVILGGEAIDSVLDPTLANINESSSSSTLLNEIYSILPQRVIEHRDKLLTTLVSYRAPRVDHFKSYWKMLLDKSGETNTTTTHSTFKGTITTMDSKKFTKFVCDNLNNPTSHDQTLKYYTIDSLALAAYFLRQGLNVKLLDMSGVLAYKRIDFFSALGCDVMNLKCEMKRFNKKRQKIPLAFLQNGYGTQILNAMATPKNTRNYGNLLPKVKDWQIDKFIRHYDCAQYKVLVENESHLDILYGDKLNKTMEECTTKFSGSPPTLEEMIHNVRAVLKCNEEDSVIRIAV